MIKWITNTLFLMSGATSVSEALLKWNSNYSRKVRYREHMNETRYMNWLCSRSIKSTYDIYVILLLDFVLGSNKFDCITLHMHSNNQRSFVGWGWVLGSHFILSEVQNVWQLSFNGSTKIDQLLKKRKLPQWLIKLNFFATMINKPFRENPVKRVWSNIF